MKIDFEKGNGLVPVIIQDAQTHNVLMLGYMNQEAYAKTVQEGKVTFYSRSKQRLWTKGETSGNYLFVEHILIDCDRDTLLIKVRPAGPVCHTGNDTCFFEDNLAGDNFLFYLEQIIQNRKEHLTSESYTARLLSQGVKKVAQKVGEEATEFILEAMDDQPERVLEEAADLVYHFLVLLSAKDLKLSDVVQVLEKRHKQ